MRQEWKSRADERAAPAIDEGEVEGCDRLYGVNPVLAALRSQRRDFHRLLLQDSLTVDKRKDRPALDELERLAEAAGIQTVLRDKHTLNMRSGNRPHQGVMLEASALEFEPMQQLPKVAKGEAPLWLALDEVTDPHNFGALLRTAFFLGADGVLVSAKNSCPLTPAVSKASAGAMEAMKVHAARNLPRTLEGAKESGWAVVGAALERSVEPSALDATQPTVLVLGSEGHGLRTMVQRACTELVRIPAGLSGELSAGASAMDGDKTDTVDSLNVSVAGGILLYAMLNARRAP